jgi:hypothetical protein
MTTAELVERAKYNGKYLHCPECGINAARFESSYVDHDLGCAIFCFRCECSELLPCTFAWDGNGVRCSLPVEVDAWPGEDFAA